MGIWCGDLMLVRHRCGAKLWIVWRQPDTPAFYSYASISGRPVAVEAVETCTCGAVLKIFHHKEWSEV